MDHKKIVENIEDISECINSVPLRYKLYTSPIKDEDLEKLKMEINQIIELANGVLKELS